MSMPLPGEIRYPSTAAHREMRWERENRAIHVSEVTHRTYVISDGPGGVVARRAALVPVAPSTTESNRSAPPQHPDQHRPQRPILLAVDQEFGEGATWSDRLFGGVGTFSLGPDVRSAERAVSSRVLPGERGHFTLPLPTLPFRPRAPCRAALRPHAARTSSGPTGSASSGATQRVRS